MFYSALKIIQKINLHAILLVFGLLLTFTSLGVAAFKIAKGTTIQASLQNNPDNVEVVPSPEEPKQTSPPSPSSLPSPTSTVLPTPKTNLPRPTTKPAQVVANPPKASPAPLSQTPNPSVQAVTASSSNCIITLFGQQYDVTPLRQTHSGGDVFRCGSDMTSTYQSKHGSNVAMMQPYLVTGGNVNGATTSNTQVSQPTPISPNTQPSKRQKEEDDDD